MVRYVCHSKYLTQGSVAIKRLSERDGSDGGKALLGRW